MKKFCQIYDYKNTRNNTWFKKLQGPKWIDLIKINLQKRFQNCSKIMEIGLSDFHKMSLTIMKMNYNKQKSKLLSRGIMKIFQTKVPWMMSKSILIAYAYFIWIFHENILPTDAPVKVKVCMHKSSSFRQ